MHAVATLSAVRLGAALRLAKHQDMSPPCAWHSILEAALASWLLQAPTDMYVAILRTLNRRRESLCSGRSVLEICTPIVKYSCLLRPVAAISHLVTWLRVHPIACLHSCGSLLSRSHQLHAGDHQWLCNEPADQDKFIRSSSLHAERTEPSMDRYETMQFLHPVCIGPGG